MFEDSQVWFWRVNDQSFLWKSICKPKVSQLWRKFWRINNLQKRNVRILNWCYLCKGSGESVDHLLFHCPIVTKLWSVVFILFGIHWVMPRTVVDQLACWQGKLGRHHNEAVWKAVPHCSMWCIWWERNNRSFEDLERNLPELKLFFSRTLLDLMTAVGSHCLFRFVIWLMFVIGMFDCFWSLVVYNLYTWWLFLGINKISLVMKYTHVCVNKYHN